MRASSRSERYKNWSSKDRFGSASLAKATDDGNTAGSLAGSAGTATDDEPVDRGDEQHSREELHEGEETTRPYRALRSALPGGSVPSYPPLDEGATPTEDQTSPLFAQPMVDLRRETFISEEWRERWLLARLRRRRAAVDEEEEKNNREEQEEEEAKREQKRADESAAARERSALEAVPMPIVLEGPKELESGTRKGRRIKRYRVLDASGNEVLVYVTLTPAVLRRNLFGTNVEAAGGKLRPCLPRSRTPPYVNELPEPTPEPEIIARFTATDGQNRPRCLRQRRLLRFVAAEQKEPRLEVEPKQSDLLHPYEFKSACFPGCSCCNYALVHGVRDGKMTTTENNEPQQAEQQASGYAVPVVTSPVTTSSTTRYQQGLTTTQGGTVTESRRVSSYGHSYPSTSFPGFVQYVGHQYPTMSYASSSGSVVFGTGQQQQQSGYMSAAGGSTYVGGSRVVTGEERVVGYNTFVQEERVLSEKVVEHEVKIPKRVVREEVIEKVIVVPETITREELVEEVQRVKETIIEVAKPVIQEKIVEVPKIEYRDKIVEVVEKIVQEKIKEVPRVEYQERIVEVPRIITQEKIVEVPEIEYRDVIVEKIVEVPEIREQVVLKEVPVPQYVERPVPEYVNVEQPYNVERNIPIPVEAVTTFEYQLAQFRPRVKKVQYPLYVPRFVEVPVAAELFDELTVAQLQAQAAKLSILSAAQAVGLCEVENLATEFRRVDVAGAAAIDLSNAVAQAWQSGRLTLRTGQRKSTTARA